MPSLWFEKVRQVAITDVLSFLGHHNFTKNGKAIIRSRCVLPNHNGPNKTGTSFCINTNENVWFCHGCQVGGNGIELVKHYNGNDTIQAANFIARKSHFETFEEVKASSPEEKEAYRKKIKEQELVHEILTIAAHHFHSQLTRELRNSLLIPQDKFDPKDTWKNLYGTWGLTDEVIEENLIGYDNGNSLLALLRKKGYHSSDILKTGLFYLENDGSIGNSVFKNRLTFPYMESGRITNFIARSTSNTWPCYEDNPSIVLEQNPSFPYAKYKKLPLHDAQRKPYISTHIQPQFFGMEEIRRKQNIVIVEGITDVILIRMFFKTMIFQGIKDAQQWGVGSFLSNQISNSHIDQLASSAKEKNLLFLCDSEESQRGSKGAFATAEKLLHLNTQVLIGTLPIQEKAKIDPAQWVKDCSPTWKDFQEIIHQAKNIVEIALENSSNIVKSIEEKVSLSNRAKIKRKEAEKVLDLVRLLPEMEMEDYIAALASPPFDYKGQQIKRIIKVQQKQESLLHSSQVEKPKENNQQFVLPGIAPEGWEITSEGLHKKISLPLQDSKYLKVAEAPIIIDEKHYDVDSGQYYLKAGFYDRNTWTYRVESRDLFMSSRKLPELAKWGFPTNTENAKELVKFITAYEAANRETIKNSQVVSSCGNKTIDNERVFVLGKRCIYDDKEEPIEFLTPDTGDLQIVNAFEAHGELEAWKQMLRKCVPYPGVMLAIYATFASPFLKYLKCKGFTTHLWGRSSIGKTITLAICASIYGDPTKLIQSWNQREVAIERRMAICNEVGIFLDELKQAIRKEDIERTLYAVTNGYGRGRGSLKGQQKTLYWLLNLLSTGEMPATQSSTDEGGQARVINVRDHLFGSGNGDLVHELEILVKSHYGLAGSKFIQCANVESIKKNYLHYQQTIKKEAKTDIARRIANNIAVILAIGEEVNRVLGITTLDARSILNPPIQELLQDASTIDRGTTALTQVAEWALANEGLFYPNIDLKKDVAGIWKEGDYLAFFPYKLKEILEKFGFNHDAIIKDWIEKEWIKSQKGKKTHPVSVNNRLVRMIVLKWKFLNKI